MAEQGATKKARDRRVRTGKVQSVSGEKTVSVAVNTLAKHPQYDKYIRRRAKYAVHDPENQARPGDLVEIVPCRPISKSKSWRLLRVVRRNQAEA